MPAKRYPPVVLDSEQREALRTFDRYRHGFGTKTHACLNLGESR